jgi:hypothetical protein
MLSVLNPLRYAPDGIAHAHAALDESRDRLAAMLFYTFAVGGSLPRKIFLGCWAPPHVTYAQVQR